MANRVISLIDIFRREQQYNHNAIWDGNIDAASSGSERHTHLYA